MPGRARGAAGHIGVGRAFPVPRLRASMMGGLGEPMLPENAATMRTANYVFSVISIVLGIALIVFVLSQTTRWNIGTAIGIVLVLNGVIRLWFAQDDE